MFFLFLYIWLRGTSAALSLRSTDGLWLEVSAAGGDFEHSGDGDGDVLYDGAVVVVSVANLFTGSAR